MQFNGRTVFVTDGNVEKALRKFKKKIANSGVLQDLKNRESYVKPTTERKTAKAQAKKRWERQLQKQQLPPKSF